MKRKALAFLLCLSMFMTAGIPGTFAAGVSTKETSSSFLTGAEGGGETASDSNATEGEKTATVSGGESGQKTTLPLNPDEESGQKTTLAPSLGGESGQKTASASDAEEGRMTASASNAGKEFLPGGGKNFDRVAVFQNPGVARTMRMAKSRAAEPENGLELEKTAESNRDGTYTIRLEAYTTGKIQTSTGVKPCDIVLVLDRSTSMNSSFSTASYEYVPVYDCAEGESYYYKNQYGNYREVEWCSTCDAWTRGCSTGIFGGHSEGTQYTPKTSAGDTASGHTQFYIREGMAEMNRLEAMQLAASRFVAQVAKKGEDSRMAIVSFGQEGYLHTGDGVDTALLPVAENADALDTAIYNIDADESATEHGKGMELAEEIFAANDSRERQRIVVMITDGEPAPSGTNNWSSRVVKQTVNSAYTLKNTYDAPVYCISVMPGTDASNPTTPMDKYMSDVSSNYPDARYTGADLDNRTNGGDTYYSDGNTTTGKNRIISQITPGAKADLAGTSYYLTAGDVETLDSIFTQISDQTGGASIPLGSSAVVKDVVSPYFTMPENVSEVEVWAYDCTAYDEETKTAAWAEEGEALSDAVRIEETSIEVSGFDFDRNFVAETGRTEGDVTQTGDFHGRKLVIAFSVEKKPGFLGGNQVPTNGSGSGVCGADGTMVEVFEMPRVNVPIEDVVVTAEDKNVYLLADVTADQLMDGAEIFVGGVALAPGEENYGLESWQNQYVDIETALTDGDGTSLGETGFSELMEDKTYTLWASVSPKNTGDNASGVPAERVTGTNVPAAKVNVFRPEISWKDSRIDLGQTARYETDNRGTVQWKHADFPDGTAVITGEAPALWYEYTPAEAAFRADTAVTVTVKAGETDLTDRVYGWVHETCGHEECQWNQEDGFMETDCQFIVHVNPFDLIIRKSGSQAVDENQSFVFRIQCEETGVDLTTVVHGNGQAVIRRLPAGTYTIREESGWSWRYRPKEEAVTLTPDAALEEVSFQNTRSAKTEEPDSGDWKWLNGCAWCDNQWKKGAAAFGTEAD